MIDLPIPVLGHPLSYNHSVRIFMLLAFSMVLLSVCAPVKHLQNKTICNSSPCSISTLQEIDINGSFQSVLIRGDDSTAPILLYVHGGPGIASIPLTGHFFSPLEDTYVVVSWDQPGAGKSFAAVKPDSGLTISRLTNDLGVLTDYLLKRFRKDKIFLVAHSFGTIIGLSAVFLHPERYEAYIGISQVTNVSAAENRLFTIVQQHAFMKHNTKAMREIEHVANNALVSRNVIHSRKILFKWLRNFGYVDLDVATIKRNLQIIVGSSEYSLIDKWHFFNGVQLSQKSMLQEMRTIDLTKTIRETAIPVYFFIGAKDVLTPLETISKFYDDVTAERKELVLFSQSGHYLMYQETEKFMRELRCRFEISK